MDTTTEQPKMTTQQERILSETVVARDKAQALLEGLKQAKAASERELQAQHRLDHLKKVTGKSAIDNAIDSTSRMIETLDRTLQRLKRELTDEDLAMLER